MDIDTEVLHKDKVKSLTYNQGLLGLWNTFHIEFYEDKPTVTEHRVVMVKK